MIARSLAAGLGLAAALATPARTAAAQGRPWTLTDAVQVEAIDDVQIAPDGGVALISVTRADVARNVFARVYQLVDLTSGKMTALPERLQNPRWSPTGTAIAWLQRARAGTAAIVLTNARGGAERTLTASPRSVVAFGWSPDGKRIAAIETAAAPAAADQARFRWMTPESDYRDTRPRKRDVYVIDVERRTEVPLTHDSWSYGGPVTDHDPSWSADGTRIAVVRQPSPLYGDFEHAQYVAIRLRDGEVEDLVGHPFFAYPQSVPPMFAPAGDAIAYTHTWDGALPSREDLYVGGRDVTAPLDRDLWSCGSGGAAWQNDSLLVSLMDGVSLRLYRVDLGGGAPRALTSQDGSVVAFSAAPGGRVAYAWTTPTAPTELYVLDPGQAPRQVTHLGALPGLAIAPTRYLEWRAPDGRTIHGQLTLPTAGDPRTAALVVELHGGPQCADDASFQGFGQYLATNGVAYFRPDPRGSDGYGDWSYKAIVGNTGDAPMADDLVGVAAVLATGVGDKDRMFLMGGSYGGYLTSWIVTHDDRFKAAVAAVPVTNLLLEYTLSESPNITRRFYGARPALDPALLLRDSPVTYAGAAHTPLLVMIGLLDTRAPYVQAIEFYKAVAESGTEARLLADAQAGHGPGDPKGTLLWQQATVGWFAAHGGPAIPGAALPK
jgi:dipeptidyl aminopeptidase/acylaminoacyl peptidase